MIEANIKFSGNTYHWSTRSRRLGNNIPPKKSMYMSKYEGVGRLQDWISPVGKIHEHNGRLFVLNDYNGLEYIYLLDEIESYNTYKVDKKGNKILEV
jgi:hypothetical protein